MSGGSETKAEDPTTRTTCPQITGQTSTSAQAGLSEMSSEVTLYLPLPWEVLTIQPVEVLKNILLVDGDKNQGQREAVWGESQCPRWKEGANALAAGGGQGGRKQV